MSVAMRSPAPTAIRSSWHNSVSTLPPETGAATPFHTVEWAAAWQGVRTEKVIRRTHLLMEHGRHRFRRRFRLPLHLIENSPLWTALEGAAGLSRPVWQYPAVFGHSIYGEYGGIPGAPISVLTEAVEQGLSVASQWSASALVIPNLPPTDLNRWCQARTPDATVGLSVAHRARLHGSVDQFIAGMPSEDASREFRRQWQQGNDDGLRLTVLRGREMLAHLPRFVEQARATSETHGPALYGADMLGPVSRVPGAALLLADHAENGPVGGFLCFRHADVLYLWTVAIGQDRGPSIPRIFGWLMHEGVRYAIATGAAILDTGHCSYSSYSSYLARIGLKPISLTSAIYLNAPDPRLISRLRAMDAGLRQRVPHARTS